MKTLKTFFFLALERNIQGKDNLERYRDDLDLVLGKMNSSSEVYIFKKKSELDLLVYNKCDITKRKGQLVKACNQY